MEARVGFFERIFGARKLPATVHPGALRLSEARPGRRLRVEAIDADDPVRSDRLAALGLVAGCEIVLRQRRPAFVIEVGETTLAVDRDLARTVRVTSP